MSITPGQRQFTRMPCAAYRVQEALGTNLYPTAAFTISGVTGYDPSLAEGEEQRLQLTGTLDLHRVQRAVTWEVEARREGNLITALATLTFRFEDFGITPPNIAGLRLGRGRGHAPDPAHRPARLGGRLEARRRELR